MPDLSLFDSYTRTDTSYAKKNEAAFTFLNRSAQPAFANIRDVLEAWFKQYPDFNKADLKARFVSEQRAEHHGAFFELFLHELLRRTVRKVLVNEETAESQTPDFLCITDDDQRFYVEATLAAEPREFQDPQITKDVLELINTAHHPLYRLSVDIDGMPTSMPKRAAVHGPILEWLDSRDHGALLSDSDSIFSPENTLTLDINGLTAQLNPLPIRTEGSDKDDEYHRMIGMGPTKVGSISFSRSIRRAIEAKGNRYKELEHPFIIAINSMSSGVSDDHVFEALVGPVAARFKRTESGEWVGEQFRQRDGAWFSERGTQYRRVSGALVFHTLFPYSIASTNYRLWLHPFARRPLARELSFAPSGRFVDGKLEFGDGQELADLLDLDPDWPEYAT